MTVSRGSFRRSLIIGGAVLALASVVTYLATRTRIFAPVPTPAPPIEFTQRLVVLEPVYFAELTELTVFSPPSVAGPIAALALPVGQNEITVAHASENTVRRWSLETNLLVAEVPVGVVADNQTSFSADATRLASFSGVWDARSGAEIWCYTKCDHAKSQTLFYPLDSWVIGYTYGSSGLAIWCIDPACNVTFIEKLDSRP